MKAGWIGIGALVGLVGAALAQAEPARKADIPRGASCIALPLREQELEFDQTPPLLSHLEQERGRQLVQKAECGRCHALPATVAVMPREKSCAGCHAWIRATREDPAAAARERKQFPLWDRYMATVSSFLEVPDLTASANRLRPDFMARYLLTPFKVRPRLHEGMIRTTFSEEEARAVSTWLAAAAAPVAWSPVARQAAQIAVSSRPEDIAEGRRLYQRLACGTCHALGEWPSPGSGPAAPDLTFVTARMSPDITAAFIADPAAFGVEARMPRYPLSPAQAARLRDYLWSPRNTPAPLALPADLPLLRRPVRYAEVRAQVLDRICVHCHMDEKRNGGEGGPGNTGGLGYRGVGLDLESWAGIQRGALDVTGRRVSIVAFAPGGEAPLVSRLRERYAEHAVERSGQYGAEASDVVGMPLGLAPLTPEQFQLVRSWVAQGAPGPVTPVARTRPRALKVPRRTAEGPKQ